MAGPSATRVVWVVSGLALIAVGLPLWKPLLLAAVLAGTLSGLHERLAARVGGRHSLAAALVTVGVVLLLLVPLAVITGMVIKETHGAMVFVKRTLAEQGLQGLLARLPPWLGQWANATLARESRTQHELSSELANWPRVRQALSAAVVVAGYLSHLAFMTAVMLVALFFLLRDGLRLVSWAERTPTMPPGRVRSLLQQLRAVSRSVLGAQLGSGFAQSVVATVGYALAGVPSPVAFGAVSLAASFIPIGGVSLVGVPLAALLWIAGRHGWAIFLAVWIVVLTTLIDNVLRPVLVRGGTHLHGGLVFFALLGGLLALGPIGIVVGPLVLALFLSVDTIERGERWGVDARE
jgi:predicted PurR-regulated permease PerM